MFTKHELSNEPSRHRFRTQYAIITVIHFIIYIALYSNVSNV